MSNPNQPPTQPIDPTLYDAGLDQRFAEVRIQAERYIGKADEHADYLQDSEVTDWRRAQNVASTAVILNRRQVSDPYRTSNPNDIPLAPETVVSQTVVGTFMGKVIGKYSVEGPNGSEISRASQPHTDPSVVVAPHRSQLGVAKRNRKQLIREAKARRSEAIHGGGIGLGQQAQVRTFAARQGIKSDLKAQFRAGAITAAEYESGRHLATTETVVVPVKAVRRQVRRERAGAVANVIRADEVTTKGFKKWRASRHMTNLHGAANNINALRDEYLQLQEAIRLRDEQ